MSLKEEIIALIAKTLDIDAAEIAADKSLYESVGVDSTEMVELSIALGRHLGVTLVQGDITNKNTPEQIVNIINGKKQ